jgi:hypothetical protein
MKANSVHFYHYVFRTYVNLSAEYDSWIVCIIFIQYDVGKLCSLVTLRIPDLYVSQCIMWFMKSMQYLNSVWCRQTVSLCNITFPGPMFFMVQDIFHEYYSRFDSFWRRQTVFTGNIMCSGSLCYLLRHMLYELFAPSGFSLKETNSVHW